MNDSQMPKRRRSRLVAAVLGFFAPGVGQLYAGRLDRGLATFAALMATQLVGLGVLFLLPPLLNALTTFATIGTAILLGICVFAAADAARLAGQGSNEPPVPRLVLLFGVAAIWATNLAAEAVFLVTRPWSRFGL